MKKSIITVSLLVGIITLFSIDYIFAQCNAWAQKTNFGGTARWGAVGFSIGNKGYIGTGGEGSVPKNDFWEYDPTTDTWTQKASVSS